MRNASPSVRGKFIRIFVTGFLLVLIVFQWKLYREPFPSWVSRCVEKGDVDSVRASNMCVYNNEFDRENLRAVLHTDSERSLSTLHSQTFLPMETHHCKDEEIDAVCPWCGELCKCNYRRSIVSIPCGYVESDVFHEGSGSGAIFDDTRSFHIHPFAGKIWNGTEPIQTFPALASGLLSVFPTHFAHFSIEILPGLIFYLHHLPPSVPILVDLRGDNVKPWLALLEELGLASPERWISWLPHTTYFAHELYFQVAEFSTDVAVREQTSWELLRRENPCSWRPSLLNGLVRDAFRPVNAHCVEPLVVVLHRAEAQTRKLTNQAEAVKALESALPGHRVQEFIGSDVALTDGIKLLQRTQVFVAPHGAGLAFMQFLEEGASVVEIGYETEWPVGYYEGNAVGLDLKYHYVVADGDKSKPLTVDIDNLVSVVVRATRRSVNVLSC